MRLASVANGRDYPPFFGFFDFLGFRNFSSVATFVPHSTQRRYRTVVPGQTRRVLVTVRRTPWHEGQ